MKRAVLMIVDGLRADLVTPEFTPTLAKLATESQLFTRQRSVFPSATRVNSASLATGCYPRRHGLAGNAIALDEGHGLQPVSVGPASFRERWRRATGRTLHVATLAQRLSDHGGVLIYSNSSAGAAHMQDPEGHAWLYHRSGSYAPGFQTISVDEHLDVSYDGNGDRITTERFCQALLSNPDQALTVLWICEPDHSQHALELGSPEHRAVLAGADRCVEQVIATVNQRREQGDEILLVVAADHGHETVSKITPVTEHLIAAGFKESPESSDVVMASSGMGALIYLAETAYPRRDPMADWLREQAWTDRVYAGAELATIGQRNDTELAIAFGMAKQDIPNRFGIMGLGAVAADPFMTNDAVGRGQHGGFGPYESNPLLLVDGSDFAVGSTDTPSSIVDIAPTILRYLNQPYADMDGTPLPQKESSQ